MLVISVLFFSYERNAQLVSMQENLRSLAHQITSEIIELHMQSHGKYQQALETFISHHKNTALALLDSKRRIMYSTIPEAQEIIDKHKEIGFYHFKDHYYLIGDRTFAHLGIAKILFKSPKPLNFSTLFFNIVLVFILAFLCVIITAVFLARLFLKPIRNEITRIDNFLKNTTHELNTPMSALLLSLKTLEDNKQHHRIKMAIKRISFLYRSLSFLVMQDINNEKPTSLDLKALILKENELFAEMIAYHKLEFKSELLEVKFKAKEQDFISLYSNLLMNAIKYNVINGHIHIELTPKFLKVKSLGHEIPKDKITELTLRYVRFNSSMLGYGIGLDLVKGVCENYKMRLVIHSEPYLNSSFYENSFCVEFRD